MKHLDPYLAYTDRYFRKWLPVYDWFGLSVFPVYRRMGRVIGPKPGMGIIDICTGTAAVALRCARFGAEVTGVDVTEAMLARARQKARNTPVRLVQMDARALTFEDGVFDTAVLSLALHDMPRKVRVQVLREAARVARNRVVILDYDLPRRPVLRKLCLEALMLFETPYLREFAREGVLPILAQVGLDRVEVIHRPLSVFSIYVVLLKTN